MSIIGIGYGRVFGLFLGVTAKELGESINWFSVIIGIAGALFGIYIWFYDRKNARKATLYFPLFLACRGVIELIKNHETLGEDRSRNLFASIAKTLDDVVYTHGSIIHLEKVDDLRIFLSLKKAIDENLEFIEQRNWAALKDKFKSEELKEVKSYATFLLARCEEEVKEIKELPE
jgi:predicted membrane channel-forming protein YqfA (hemolysin III family)